MNKCSYINLNLHKKKAAKINVFHSWHFTITYYTLISEHYSKSSPSVSTDGMNEWMNEWERELMNKWMNQSINEKCKCL